MVFLWVFLPLLWFGCVCFVVVRLKQADGAKRFYLWLLGGV